MNKQRSVCRVSDRAGWWVSQVLSWRSQKYLLGKLFQKFPGVFSWGAATVAVSGGAGKGCSLRALELPRYPCGDCQDAFRGPRGSCAEGALGPWDWVPEPQALVESSLIPVLALLASPRARPHCGLIVL